MIQALCRLFFARKQLILLKKSDLSTERSAFTITTIFIYQSIVNRQKKRERRRFFQQPANSAKKSVNGDPDSHCQTVCRNPWSILVNMLASDPDAATARRQGQKPWFLLAAVDNCLYIHRMRCGKSRSLSTGELLSQTSPASIQCLCSAFFRA